MTVFHDLEPLLASGQILSVMVGGPVFQEIPLKIPHLPVLSLWVILFAWPVTLLQTVEALPQMEHLMVTRMLFLPPFQFLMGYSVPFVPIQIYQISSPRGTVKPPRIVLISLRSRLTCISLNPFPTVRRRRRFRGTPKVVLTVLTILFKPLAPLFPKFSFLVPWVIPLRGCGVGQVLLITWPISWRQTHRLWSKKVIRGQGPI